MKNTILQRNFYLQDTRTVAEKLLGKLLVREVSGTRLSGIIVETEAYRGFDDSASHAHKGPTERCKVMYGQAGHAYIYLTYGIHFMLNFVTEEKFFPAAVLIRAIEPYEGEDVMMKNRSSKDKVAISSGPAKLTKAIAITKDLNGIDITKKDKIWVEEHNSVFLSDSGKIERSSRIGIDYALKKDREKKWRFTIKGNKFVSK